MIDKILTNLDTDVENNEQIINYSIALAKVLGAKLIYLHTYPIPANYAMSGTGEMTAYSVAIPVAEELAIKKEKEIRILLENIPEADSVQYEYISQPGIAGDMIDDQAEELEADLVIMGAHGTSGIEAFIGTLAERVTRKSHCPVIVFPQDHPHTSLNKICLAIDTTYPIDEGNLTMLLKLAEAFDCTLDVVHVQPEEKEPSGKSDSNLFEQLISQMSKYKITYSFSVLSSADIGQELLKFTEKNQIDLLALVYRPHGFLKRMFNPGIRKKLVSQSELPLLILK